MVFRKLLFQSKQFGHSHFSRCIRCAKSNKTIGFTQQFASFTLFTKCNNQSVSMSSSSSILQLTERNQVQWIRLNRPQRFNAMNTAMYEALIEALRVATNNDNVKFAVIIGNGKMFSSGNDLNNFAEWQQLVGGNDFSEAVNFGCNLVQRYVDALIDFPKPLIGAVNGPAFGIASTSCALFDTVIAAERATFVTPFSSLALSPEGCSSYMFPRILGPSLASEMLLFNRTITAKEAVDRGLVFRVIADDDHNHNRLDAYLERWLYEPEIGLVNVCYRNAVINAKGLTRNKWIRERLHAINRNECEVLRRSFLAPECRQALSKFFDRKTKK